MAQKFVPLDDAADHLGISKERLNELREAGKVRAYRDGTSWKFRAEDLTALSKELTAPKDPSVSDLALEALEDPSDPSDSILVSDAEVGGPPNRPPSTVIGEKKKGKSASESDLELTLEEEFPRQGRGDSRSAATSDVLASSSGSHVLGPSETPPVPSGKFEDLDEIEIDLETESSKIQSDFDLPKPPSRRAAEEESDLRIVESGVHERRSSGAKGTVEESGIRLAEDEEDDLVLSESGGSDVTLSPGDSGINLVSPADSGLALDELDLDLGGAGISSLDIAESAEKIQIEEEPVARSRTARKDDDFLLTPLGEAGEEDSSSQVIELDSAAELQESAAMLTERTDETAVLEPVEDEDQVVLEERRGLAPAAILPAEAVHFTGANVAFLSVCVLILAVCGLMTLDLLRNIWSWSQPYSVNSWLMESLNFFS
jgi:excisionase family DNA binding protein